MNKKRINLKELSELLAKEVENGNGDAYVFIGEYYVSSDKWKEESLDSSGNVVTTEHVSPYNIYTDETVKEKIMALNYLHVQKLTEEENIELTKRLEEERYKKSASKYKKSSGYGFDNTYYEPARFAYRDYVATVGQAGPAGEYAPEAQPARVAVTEEQGDFGEDAYQGIDEA